MLEGFLISVAGRLNRFPGLQRRVASGLLDDRGVLTEGARRTIQTGLQSKDTAVVRRTSRAHTVAAYAGEARGVTR